MKNIPNKQDILDAVERIHPYVHRTPIFSCQTINNILDMEIFFKCENFQKVGAFKFRGACNAVFSLSEAEAARGVATHSSGNHAQALALAARLRGIQAHIVVPENAPEVKKAAIAGYGAKITYCTPTLEARETTTEKIIAETGATLIHAYNDARIIAGQASAALEILNDLPDLDVIMAPVGGGGLLSGAALAAHYFYPNTKVIAGEPAGADDAFRSLKANQIIPSVQPKTIADGLLTSLGNLTFEIIRTHVQEIATVSEASIKKAMRTMWERMKIIVEPSAAVPLGALMENDLALKKKRIGIILSGGNVDLAKLPWR